MESPITSYLLSLLERVLRSASALAGGLLHEIGGATLPEGIRRSRLYVNLVELTLRFLIEQVGEVDGMFPSEEELNENFLLRRTAGGGLELIGILAFRASPVWILAALADVTGAGPLPPGRHHERTQGRGSDRTRRRGGNSRPNARWT